MSNLTFNVAGPCIPGEHYMLDPLRGIESDLMSLIEGKLYYVIHASRQTGKTTLLQNFATRINNAGKYHAVYCSLESLDRVNDPAKGIPAILDNLTYAFEAYGLPPGFAANADRDKYLTNLRSSICAYCKTLDKPLVIFFDEADSLSEDTLISFLRQLRDGHNSRGQTPFLHSVALVGMRNLRDYKARVRPDSESLGGPSPFNIIKKSHSLRNFTHAEVAQLYAQHTNETGQVFEQEMVDYVFEQTQGQPWLVNAIACECIEEILKNNKTITVTKPHAEQAIQNIVRDRRTHIDSMMDKLKDRRVRKIVNSLIVGDDIREMGSDDYLFTRDLGLIRDDRGKIEPANPIYAELIIRTLNWDVQKSLEFKHPEYALPRYLKNGRIDMDYLIKEFQVFWRENGGVWEEHYEKSEYQYNEAAAQLVMQGFLQRVINGGGHVIREMAANRQRADMCVVYNDQKYPLELKILQNERSRAESLEQILKYMDSFGADTGWLVIFDRNKDKSWDEKIFMNEEIVNGKTVVVVGC